MITEIIDNNKVVMLLYPAGVGGEFVTKLIADHTTRFNNITSIPNTTVNQHSVICLLRKLSTITDLKDKETWLNEHYFENEHEYSTDKLFLNRDHPDLHVLRILSTIADNVRVLFLDPGDSIEYFSKLFLKKMSERVTIPLTNEFLTHRITNDVVEQQMLHKVTKDYEWVWTHEMGSWLVKYRSKDPDQSFVHHDSVDPQLDFLIKSAEENTRNVYTMSRWFKSFKVLHANELPYSSDKLLNEIAAIYNDFDVTTAKPLLDKWIEDNNKLKDLPNAN